MPRLPIDYQKTVIYKIVCNDLSVLFTYVGMTTDFTNRKRNHKNSCNNVNNNRHNLKVYQIIRLNGGWDNWNMLIIEQYPCNNDIEARLKEREWYEKLNANLNSIRPLATKEEHKEQQKEYTENHKEQMKEYRDEYNETHKEESKAQHKEYYETHKEEIKAQCKEYQEAHKDEVNAKRKEYREAHKDEVNAKQKLYRETHKDEVNAKQKLYRETKKIKLI